MATTKTAEMTADTMKTRLFAFVRETTERAKALEMGERVKASKAVSESTAGTYARLAKSRLDTSSETGGRLMDGVSARSWHTTRAALLHEATKAFMTARKACDVAQREGDITTAISEAKKARRALEAFKSVQDAEKPETTTAKRSARKTLPKSADWQGRAYEASTDAQKPAVAVLWASGCRPAEIGMGVDVSKRKGGTVLIIEIPGAKVKDNAGQPRRSIAITADSDAGKALIEVMGEKERMTIIRPAQRIGKDLATIREKTGLKITAYSFRHQFAAEMKDKYGAHTVGAEQVAQAMGHRVTRSQQHYGSRAQAKGGSGVLAVKAELPIRETRQRPAPPQSPAMTSIIRSMIDSGPS